MSILESQVIDIIATRPGSNVVKLVIADHLEWHDFDMHAMLLQAKFNTYLEFIESGQLAHAVSRGIPLESVRITLVLQHPPSVRAQQFLDHVRMKLHDVAVVLEVDVRA